MAAPDAVNTAVFPEQTVAEFTLIVGVALTVTVAVLTLLHPLVVPVTVYTVVDEGEGLMVARLLPVFHEYPEAPLAVSVALFPEQIVLLFTVTVGFGFTVIVRVVEFWQMPPLLPVKV